MEQKSLNEKNTKKLPRRAYALRIICVLIALSAVLCVWLGIRVKNRYDLWTDNRPLNETPTPEEEQLYQSTGNLYYDYVLEYGPEERGDSMITFDYAHLLYDYYNGYSRVEKPSEEEADAFLVCNDMEDAFFYYMYRDNGLEELAQEVAKRRAQTLETITRYTGVPGKTDALIERYLENRTWKP